MTACKKETTPASNTTKQTKIALSPEEAKQQRLEWNLKTLVEPYEHAGYTNSKWDTSATLALTEFARSRASVMDINEPVAEIIATNAAAAVQAGCDDPMVNYLYIKFAMDQTNSKEAFVKAFSKMAKEMNQSSYPPIRKFYAAARTLDQIFYSYGTNSPNQSVETDIMPLLRDSLNATLADKTMPAQEAYEVADLTLTLMSSPRIYMNRRIIVWKNHYLKTGPTLPRLGY